MAQGRVTRTTEFSGIAVNGAAMLTGFYHRSVLRCGCLAERKSGVEGILTATRRAEKDSFRFVWRSCLESDTPGQPTDIDRNL
jgi:hypothetical protein